MCFLEGALVLLERGYVPIEYILPSDNIMVFSRLSNTMGFEIGEPVPVNILNVVFVHAKISDLSEFLENSISEGVPSAPFYPTKTTRVLLEGKFKNCGENVVSSVVSDGENIKIYHILTENHSVIKINNVFTETIVPSEVDKMISIFPQNLHKFTFEENTLVKVLREINDEFVTLELPLNQLKVRDLLDYNVCLSNNPLIELQKIPHLNLNNNQKIGVLAIKNNRISIGVFDSRTLKEIIDSTYNTAVLAKMDEPEKSEKINDLINSINETFKNEPKRKEIMINAMKGTIKMFENMSQEEIDKKINNHKITIGMGVGLRRYFSPENKGILSPICDKYNSKSDKTFSPDGDNYFTKNGITIKTVTPEGKEIFYVLSSNNGNFITTYDNEGNKLDGPRPTKMTMEKV